MELFSEINQAGLKLSVHGDQVRVENAECLTDRLRNLIRANKPALIWRLSKATAPNGLSANDEAVILNWLAHISETDPETIAETLDCCHADAETLAYFLGRAKETPAPVITCGDCQHFECFNAHGRGAGACNADIKASGVCLWSDTPHLCDQFMQKTIYSPTSFCNQLIQ
ncbi:MAG: hypothetical protein PHY16_07140 [Methylobacter sp.]|nr:hypothetical protein [Methylobacter sp.]